MGTMRLCRGDLLEASTAIAHGCNVVGAMGAGVAADIKQAFPSMYDEYHQLCKDHKVRPGDIFASEQLLNGRNIMVYNLMTQTGLNGADMQFMREAFERMIDDANKRNISIITIPMIGAGLGGISPSVCFNIYLEAVEKYNGRLNVIVQYIEHVKPHPITDDTHDPRNMYKRAMEQAKTQAMKAEFVKEAAPNLLKDRPE